jgi:hypothetical protein
METKFTSAPILLFLIPHPLDRHVVGSIRVMMITKTLDFNPGMRKVACLMQGLQDFYNEFGVFDLQDRWLF